MAGGVARASPDLVGAFSSGVGDESCLLAADDRIVVTLTIVGDSGMLGERGRSAVEEQHPVGDCGMEMGRDFMPITFSRKDAWLVPPRYWPLLVSTDQGIY